jgi:hypothetical protein
MCNTLAVIPAKAGIHVQKDFSAADAALTWIPAFAGMTTGEDSDQ